MGRPETIRFFFFPFENKRYFQAVLKQNLCQDNDEEDEDNMGLKM